MEKIKLCEICGKEVVKGRDKYLNILNRYYHDDCLDKEKTIVKEKEPTFSQEQVTRMTFDEKLTYLDERIRSMTSKYNISEHEAMELRMILRQISEKYAAAAKPLDSAKRPNI